jgi:hypothetical protein
VIEKMAPQAGFEPATLRLTGGKNELPRFAALCCALPDLASAGEESGDFLVSPVAGLCRALPAFAAAKGQEKGNVPNHDF